MIIYIIIQMFALTSNAYTSCRGILKSQHTAATLMLSSYSSAGQLLCDVVTQMVRTKDEDK